MIAVSNLVTGVLALRGLHKRRVALALGIAAVLLLGACRTSPAPPPDPRPTSVYRVSPPDQLSIEILPEPITSRSVTIRPDGMITVDLIGDVVATGRTPEEIALEIQERVAYFKRDALVTVGVQAAQSNVITIFGQVNGPGVQVLSRETRISEAIGLVGGTTIYAAKNRVRVIRTDGKRTDVLDVNLGDIQKGDLSTDIEVLTGDIVVVPPNAFARIGFALQTMLFPFQPLFQASTVIGIAGTAGAF